jgi:hypothetical protein
MFVLPCCERYRLLPVALVVLIGVACPVRAQSPPAARPRRPIAVFAADGAGNFRTASMMLRQVIDEDALPIELHSFEWSHGYARVLSDQVAFSHARDKAKLLAEQIVAYHAAFPKIPIYVYAHSAGCAVATKAIEELPLGLVERVVLLAPSLSATYDVVPCLERVNRGLHVFYSRQDWCFLGVCTYMVGTADRRFSCCSGRVGFKAESDQLDPVLARKLHQHAWQPDERALGNNGGHFGGYQPAYVRMHIIPLLLE